MNALDRWKKMAGVEIKPEPKKEPVVEVVEEIIAPVVEETEEKGETIAEEVVVVVEAIKSPEAVEVMFKPNEFSKNLDQVFQDAMKNLYYDSETNASRKFILPADVKKGCTQRIKEIENIITNDDEKGYNDNSVKTNAIDALNQILDSLSTKDEEGFKQAVIFLDTLMSPIMDLLPNPLIKFLRQSTVA